MRQQARGSRHEEASVGCVHHWVIETPAGAVSRGECKRCGEMRFFPNSDDNAGLNFADQKPWCSKCGCTLARGAKVGHERTCAGPGRKLCLGCNRVLKLEEFGGSGRSRLSRCGGCTYAKQRGAA